MISSLPLVKVSSMPSTPMTTWFMFCCFHVTFKGSSTSNQSLLCQPTVNATSTCTAPMIIDAHNTLKNDAIKLFTVLLHTTLRKIFLARETLL